MSSDPNVEAIDTNTTAAGPQLGIQRIYIKDLSFESPLGPGAQREPRRHASNRSWAWGCAASMTATTK